MNFEEFLKEKKGFGSDGYYFCQDSKGTEIEIKALGEWAWENGLDSIKEHIEESKPRILDFQDFNAVGEFDDYGIDFFSIAVACLGEKEIRKRLSELK